MDDNDTGLVFLEHLNEAERLNRWIYDYIEPDLGQSVLEVGCGIGNITAFLTESPVRRVAAIDIEPSYIDIVRAKFGTNSRFQALLGDITDEKFVSELARQTFDTVVCLNVLEHVKDDGHALQVFYRLLKPGGRLVLLCPAHTVLYGSMDRYLGHFRRYSRAGLVRSVTQTGFRVIKAFHFNSFSVAGWFINGKLLRRRHASPMQIRIVELIVPFFRFIEDRVKLPFGLSVLVVAEK